MSAVAIDPHRGRLPSLDGVRALAVGAVLALHADVPFARGGGIGVDVFFVLSGFLITSLLLRQHERQGRIRLGSFYLRRALRLWPALLFLLAVTALLAWALQGRLEEGFALERMDGASVTAGLYLSDIAVAFGGLEIGPYFHTWSLAIEEHFYLLWPLVLLALLRVGLRERRLAAAILVLALSSSVWRAYLESTGARPGRLLYAADTQADHLLVGCALAVMLPLVLDRWRGERVAAVGAAAALLLAALVVLSPSASTLNAGGYLGVALLAGVLVGAVALAGDRGVLRPLGHPLMAYAGRLSYSLYLWHFVLFHLVTAEALGVGSGPAAVAKIVATMIAAMVSYHLVERPVLAWRDRRARAAPTDAPAPSLA